MDRRYLRLLASGALGIAAACGSADQQQASAASATAAPVDIDVVVTGVQTDSGILVSTLCRRDERFPSGCALRAQTQARRGAAVVQFKGVPAGEYAFAVYHDANKDGQLAVTPDGFPQEGIGFGNDAIGPAGPPTFAASALEVNGTTQATVRLRYWQRPR